MGTAAGKPGTANQLNYSQDKSGKNEFFSGFIIYKYTSGLLRASSAVF